jgi:hypothetical protein
VNWERGPGADGPCPYKKLSQTLSPDPHKGAYEERLQRLELLWWHRRLACAHKKREKCLFVRVDAEEKRKGHFVGVTIKH